MNVDASLVLNCAFKRDDSKERKMSGDNGGNSDGDSDNRNVACHVTRLIVVAKRPSFGDVFDRKDANSRFAFDQPL